MGNNLAEMMIAFLLTNMVIHKTTIKIIASDLFRNIERWGKTAKGPRLASSAERKTLKPLKRVHEYP